jgi:hypothetical protein
VIENRPLVKSDDDDDDPAGDGDEMQLSSELGREEFCLLRPCAEATMASCHGHTALNEGDMGTAVKLMEI